MSLTTTCICGYSLAQTLTGSKEEISNHIAVARDDLMRLHKLQRSITAGHLHMTHVPAVEETSNAMALDGIMFEGVSVRVRRPNDYNPAAAAALGPSVPNPALNLAAIGLQPGAGTATAGGVSGWLGWPVEHC